MQELPTGFAYGLSASPAIQLFGAVVPEGDHVIGIADYNGILHQLQNACLL